MNKKLILFSILLFILCSCEESSEKKFDRYMPGTYESYALVKYKSNDSLKVEYIPESWGEDGATYPVEIVKSGNESFTLYFDYTDPRLPDQITVEIIEHVEQTDPSGFQAYVKLLGDSGYQLLPPANSNYASSSTFSIVYHYGKVYYYINMRKESTNDTLYCGGYRDF
jgi:hypothetical protein